MQALEPRVIAAVWAALEPLLPQRPPDHHPLGCHRVRIADRDCFGGILVRLVTGCSWRTAGRLGRAGATTLRSRRDEWLAAAVFERLVEEALAAYDRIIGLDLSEVALDGSTHKAPAGGEGTGPNPTDRGKRGWKWSVATDRHGIPLGWATAAANRHDSKLLGPTLDAVGARGLLADVETLHLDRGYDYKAVRTTCAEHGIADVVCARRRPRGSAQGTKRVLPLGLRWPVERTNAWLANFGQLRRSTDRCSAHRLAQVALAVVFILTVKLIAWADRWNC
ncbi:MAG: IS5 family transposase [Candidatus Limnocylindrales bacterium]